MKFRLRLYFLTWGLIGLRAGFAHALIPPDWQAYARRLTGESFRVRSDLLNHLAADQTLIPKLKRALATPDRFLALDVITALQMRSLIPDLLEFGRSDDSGYGYQAINTLMTADNRTSILLLYQERLILPQTPVASKVALLDSLARSDQDLKVPVLHQLLQSANSDLRASTLYYLRSRGLRGKFAEYSSLFTLGVHDPAVQLRLQTISSLIEIKQLNGTLMQACLSDPDPEVRTFCQKGKP